jgi:hypothetical protein
MKDLTLPLMGLLFVIIGLLGLTVQYPGQWWFFLSLAVIIVLGTTMLVVLRAAVRATKQNDRKD